MKPKTIFKIAIDFFLAVGLLLLMAYELIGKASAHVCCFCCV